jgi:predicted transcriptional regulator
MDQKDIPYIFVLDKDGKIIYQTSGAYSDEKIEKMDELVAEEE